MKIKHIVLVLMLFTSLVQSGCFSEKDTVKSRVTEYYDLLKFKQYSVSSFENLITPRYGDGERRSAAEGINRAYKGLESINYTIHNYSIEQIVLNESKTNAKVIVNVNETYAGVPQNDTEVSLWVKTNGTWYLEKTVSRYWNQ